MLKWMSRFLKKEIVASLVRFKLLRLASLPGVRIGRKSTVDLRTKLEPHVVVGANCHIESSEIGRGTYLTEYSSLRHTKVGRFCAIADNVRTGSGTHPAQTFVSIHPAFYSTIQQAGFTFVKNNLFNEMPRVTGSRFVVEIGNDVWIGSGARILDGVRIGDGAIIGAGAIVTKDVEPYSVNVGVPAKKIRYRFSPEQIQFLLDFCWWDREISWIKDHAEFFQDIEILKDRLSGNQYNTK